MKEKAMIGFTVIPLYNFRSGNVRQYNSFCLILSFYIDRRIALGLLESMSFCFRDSGVEQLQLKCWTELIVKLWELCVLDFGVICGSCALVK